MILTKEEKLKNLADCVLQSTVIKREHNGKSRGKTYATDVDTIALQSRKLAEAVHKFLNNQLMDEEVTTKF